MEVTNIDSRVINGVRIFRACVWNKNTHTGKNLYASTKQGLHAKVANLLKAEEIGNTCSTRYGLG